MLFFTFNKRFCCRDLVSSKRAAKTDHIQMWRELFLGFWGVYFVFIWHFVTAFTKMRLYLLTRLTLAIFFLTQLLKENTD